MDFSFLTLEEILKVEPSLLGERLYIITLRQFRESLGDEWSRYAEKVQLIAESVVRRHVGRKCATGREGDDTFILSFASLSKEDGARLAAEIATDFMKHLIGERFSDAPIGVGDIPRDQVVRGDGTVDGRALDRAISETRAMRLDADGNLVALADDPLDGFLKPIEPQQRDGAVRTITEQRRAQPKDSEPQWQPLRWPPLGLMRPEALTIPPIDPEDALPDDIEIGYRAVWSRGRGMEGTYRALPIRCGKTGSARVLAGDASEGARANLDLALAFAALELVERGIELRRPLHVLVPVRFASTQPPIGIQLDQVLRYFPDPARARHLMIELVDLPDGLNRETLGAAVARLQGLCRDVLLRANGRVPLDTLLAARPGAIGWALGGRPEAEACTLIDAFARSFKGARLYLWGVRGGRILAAAHRAEAAFLNADAVYPDDRTLTTPVPDPLAASMAATA